MEIEVLRPTRINMLVNPERYLMMAALAKYAGMRFYPSALNDGSEFAHSSDFEGLPYFGEPQPFMRRIVQDHAPELLLHDTFVTNPLFNSTSNKAYMMRVEYEPAKYPTAGKAEPVSLGEMSHPRITPDAIVQAEESIRLRLTFFRQ